MTSPLVNTPDGSVCPHCGGPTPAASAMIGDEPLTPGCIVFCLHCHAPCVLDEQCRPRTPTGEELRYFERQPAYREARAIVDAYREMQAAIARRQRHMLS